ncbi:hypothetical protein GIB67_009747 [Kingdonia uniflora]|uniref:Uncharacterized protein n=1 Tax=Kingdonia uniflora TaxID=39325 RepID=A0A7J7LBK3_9MAGN|nr:hypothetical protein GIB67_009747 [Kingdonia uniflora]
MIFSEIPSFNTPPEFSSNPNLRYGKSSSCRPMPRPTMERNEGRDEGVMDPVVEMVASIRMLGEGYMRMEEKQIEASKEIMRM